MYFKEEVNDLLDRVCYYLPSFSLPESVQFCYIVRNTHVKNELKGWAA